MKKADITVSNQKNVFDENSMTFEERQKDLQIQDELEEEARKRDKKSPYSNWYQFNKEHTKEMIWLATKYPKAQAILLFLLEQMDSYNAVMCSYQVFQDVLAISKQTITRSIKILKDKGFVHIMKSGTSNVYIINSDLAWNSWGNNHKYCKFPANVILSIDEQNDIYQNKIKAMKNKEISTE